MPINAEVERQGFTTISNDFLWDPEMDPLPKLIVIRVASTVERRYRTAGEIAIAIGIAYTTAQMHLKSLEQSGVVVREGRSRKNQIVYTVPKPVAWRVQL